MPTEILMPALSPRWRKARSRNGWSRKATPSPPATGWPRSRPTRRRWSSRPSTKARLGKILVAEGTEGVKVNTPIAVLLEEGESADDIAVARPTSAEAEAGRRGPRQRRLRAAREREAAPARQASPPRAAPKCRRQAHLRLAARPPDRRGQGARPGADQGLGPARPHRQGRCRSRGPAAPSRARRRTEAAARRRAGAAAMPAGPSADAGREDVRGPRLRGGQARRDAQDRRRAADRGQADDPAFLPAPRRCNWTR
jgi:pyruvate dehydrogenase E2 component (dihydrolipoamide acetyltransferase)